MEPTEEEYMQAHAAQLGGPVLERDAEWMEQSRREREEEARIYEADQLRQLGFQARAEALRLALGHAATEGGAAAEDVVAVARTFASFLIGEPDPMKAN